MAGRHKKARRELSAAQTRVLRGSMVAAPLCAGLLAGATNASAQVNTLPSGSGTHAPAMKGTGPGTGRPPVITWDFMNGVDAASQQIIHQGVQNWDQALRKQTGTTTPWFTKASPGGTPGLLFNIARLNGGLAGLAGDNCTFTRVQCGHGQRVTLNSDWWHGRATSEQKLGVVAHEMGHALGLGHATGGRESVPGNPDEVMRPTIAFRGAPGTPSANETATVAKIYGQSSKGPTTPVTPTTQQPGPKQNEPADKQTGPTIKQTGPTIKENGPVAKQQPQPPTQQNGWQGEWRRNSQGQWEGHWQRDGWQGDWRLVDGKWQGQWTPAEKQRQAPQGQQQTAREGQAPAQQAALADHSSPAQSPTGTQGQNAYQQAGWTPNAPAADSAHEVTGGSTAGGWHTLGGSPTSGAADNAAAPGTSYAAADTDAGHQQGADALGSQGAGVGNAWQQGAQSAVAGTAQQAQQDQNSRQAPVGGGYSGSGYYG